MTSPIKPDPHQLPKKPPKLGDLDTVVAGVKKKTTSENAGETKLFPQEIHEEFEIKGPLGGGSMGAVYAAREKAMDRDVAIKTIIGDVYQENLVRFKEEARALANLKHPSIAQVYRLIEVKNNFYLIHQLIEGKNFKEEIKTLYENGYDQADKAKKLELLEALVQIAKGVAFVHNKDIVHRDIKPANIMYDSKEKRAYLVDFGLVKRLKRSEESIDNVITKEGETLGTPMYMSPEQMLGKKDIDYKKSDIFSLGAILNHLLTSKYHITPTGNPQELLIELSSDSKRLPKSFDPNIPDDLHNIAAKALAHDPNKRFDTAEEFAQALESAINKNYYPDKARLAIPKKRNYLVPTTIGTLGAITLSGWLMFTGSGKQEAKKEESKKQEAKKEISKKPKKPPLAKKSKPNEEIDPKLVTELSKLADAEIKTLNRAAYIRRAYFRLELGLYKDGEIRDKSRLEGALRDYITASRIKTDTDIIVPIGRCQIAIAKTISDNSKAIAALNQAIKTLKKADKLNKSKNDKQTNTHLYYLALARFAKTQRSPEKNVDELEKALSELKKYKKLSKLNKNELQKCESLIKEIQSKLFF